MSTPQLEDIVKKLEQNLVNPSPETNIQHMLNQLDHAFTRSRKKQNIIYDQENFPIRHHGHQLWTKHTWPNNTGLFVTKCMYQNWTIART